MADLVEAAGFNLDFFAFDRQAACIDDLDFERQRGGALCPVGSFDDGADAQRFARPVNTAVGEKIGA